MTIKVDCVKLTHSKKFTKVGIIEDGKATNFRHVVTLIVLEIECSAHNLSNMQMQRYW